MPKRQPLQTTFEAGVASPLVYGRSDLPGYHKSAKDMLNMFADTRGPAISRNGFEYKDDVADASDRYGRLFTFRASATETYIVAITPTSVWITDKTGFIESANKLTNGDFVNDGTGWTESTGPNGSITYPSDLARLSSGAALLLVNSYAYIEQNVTGLTAVNTHIIRVNTTFGTPSGSVVVEIGTAQGLKDIVNNSFTGPDIEISFTPNVTSIWIRIRVNGIFHLFGPPEEPLVDFINNTRDIDIVALVDLVTDPDAGFVTFTSPWTEDQIHDLQVEMAPDDQSMYFVHREVTPQKLSVDDATPRVWTFAAVSFTWAATDPWTTEFPGAITFFQSRLYLAGTVKQPVTIWASKPGAANYTNFDDSVTTAADDPIKLILARNADIQWMQGSKVLYIGCDNSEHIITSDGSAVVNSDVKTDQQSANGSARIKTNWVSSKIAFTSWDQRRLRLMSFDSNSRLMGSEDLTFASEHLTKALITEMHHRQHPVNTIFTLLADGTFLSCVLEIDRGIVAWSPHSLKVGSIKSLTIANEQGVSALYALELRNNRLRLLRMGDAAIFMDDYVNRSYDTPTNTVDRLDHLDGETVQVIGDGNLYPDAVVASGEITTDGPEATNYSIGIGMNRLLETMLVDDVRGGSSSIASKKGWNRIYVRVLDSGLPKINGKRPSERTPTTPMNEREPNISEDIIVQGIGWDYEGTIIVTQDLPLNLVVTGIYGELSEENL